MTTRVLDRYSCACSARANRNWRNSSLIVSSLIFAAFIILSGAFLSGCSGVTSAKGSGSATTATNSDTTTSDASGTLSVSPAAVTFGNVAVGSASNQSLSVTNSGTVAITISQATVTGAGFTMGGASLPLTLSPGNTFTFTASFDPTAAGNDSGSLSIVSPQLSSPLAISMSGTGMAVAPAITSQPLSESVLTGQTATFSVTASGTAPLSYQWSQNGTAITGATSSSYTTPAETTSANGAKFAVVVSNTAGSVTSNSATLAVTAAAVAPSITSQPANQTTFAGQTATFSVIASGTAPLSYQWQKNGAAIGGAISSSYTTPAEVTSDNGAQFTVVVSNTAGTIISNAATLTVNPDPVAPSITAQPASQTINAGQTATFSVTATGTAPLSYQWQKNSATIAGATSSSYTTPAETASDNGAQFSVVVSNSAGTVTSNAAILTVNAPPAITAQPVNQTVAVGQTATFSVTATGTAPLSYQWRKNSANISGATASTYTTPATASTDNGAQFSVVISNAAGSVTSNTATLTVNVPPSITTQPSSVTITAGQTATFSVTAAGTAPLTYQWSQNGTAISGATSASYTTPTETTSASGAQFTVVVSNSVGNVTSSAATLTVNAAPVAPSITAQPSSVTITAGQTATFSVTATGTAPLNYQWSQNGTAISGATSASYTTPTETTSASGTQFTVVVSNSTGNVTSNAATLTVNAAPVAPSITTQPSSVTITAGQTATFSVAATGTAPLTYQWSQNGTAISGATSASYTTPTETTSASGTQFTVVVSNSVGNVTSSAATLTVNAAPVAPSITAQPSSVTITAGQTATFSVTATGTAPLTYQWSQNGTAISGATSASYTTPAETTSASGSQFTVVVSNSAGSATSNAATLTVNAPPPGALTPSTTSLNFNNVTVGTNSSLGVNLTNSGSTNITVSNVTISGAGLTASGVSNGQIITPGQVVPVNVTFAPSATGGVTGSVTVTSNASNSPVSISLSGTGVPAHSATLNWTASTSTVIGYDVYRGTVSGGPYTLLTPSPITGTQYVDSSVTAGQTYYYVVTAVASGNVQSADSNQVSGTIPTP